jgi:hypothetical protein
LKKIAFLTFAVFTSILFASTTQATECLNGFTPIDSAVGVEMCKKGDTIVQIIDLTQASIEFLYEKSNDGLFVRKKMKDFWDNYTQKNSAFSMVNGAFFDNGQSPNTQLPWPLKSDGAVITIGYGRHEYPNQKMMLELHENSAKITPLNDDYNEFNASDAPNITSGLTEDANKHPLLIIGRTFVGTSLDETKLYILVDPSAWQSTAANILRSFGAHDVMMLDGHGSSQLYSHSEVEEGDGRLIPHVMIIRADKNSINHTCYFGRLGVENDHRYEPHGTYFRAEGDGVLTATCSGPQCILLWPANRPCFGTTLFANTVLSGPDYLQLDPHYLQRARKQRTEPTLFANRVSAFISKSLVSS